MSSSKKKLTAWRLTWQPSQDDLDAGSVRGVSTSNRGLLTSRHRTGEDAREALDERLKRAPRRSAITPRSDGSAEVQVDGGSSSHPPDPGGTAVDSGVESRT